MKIRLAKKIVKHMNLHKPGRIKIALRKVNKICKCFLILESYQLWSTSTDSFILDLGGNGPKFKKSKQLNKKWRYLRRGLSKIISRFHHPILKKSLEVDRA